MRQTRATSRPTTKTSTMTTSLWTSDLVNQKFVMRSNLELLRPENESIPTGEEAGGGPSGSGADKRDDEYQYEILTTEQIVEFMVKELKEVQNVIQVFC